MRTQILGLSAIFVVALAMMPGEASSHREAPLLAMDPMADNTDVYAFVSPDASDTVTLIANFIPFQKPDGGPNFYSFDPNVVYEIHVDNNGDAIDDITYQWRFTTEVRNTSTFLYNTGAVTSLDDPSVTDASNVNFTIAEPFVAVTRPNLSTHVWTAGTKQTIQWASNLGALEKVAIELSQDGGSTYPIVLLAATPSDGKQAITVQSGWITAAARVRITWVKSAVVSDSSDESFAIR